MAIYPAAAIFLLIWLLLTLRNADNGLLMAIAVIPFGMFAAIVAGGLSMILAHFLVVLTIGALLTRALSTRHAHVSTRLPPSAIYLSIFAIYSLFSGLILVRLFQGQFLVFPLSVTFHGTLVSTFYPSTMIPLAPNSSNISQTFFIVLSTMFFIALLLVIRRRGLEFVTKGLAWAAGLNALLGLMDLLQLDPILSFVRTADYALNNEHMLGGLSRVIGGYSEAAAFGSVSAALFAYFAMTYLITNKSREGLLALANLCCALLAVSSTAILAIAFAFMLILMHAHIYLRPGISRRFAHHVVIALSGLIIVICLVLMLTPAETFIARMLDSLLFSKGNSMSGLERSAWAKSGLDAFIQTYGLGAGAGSLRSNGFAMVLLGNVGLPGTIAFVMYLWHGIGKPISACTPTQASSFYAGRVSALTLLGSMMVSATGPDPTLLLMATVCVSVIAREQAKTGPYVSPAISMRAA